MEEVKRTGSDSQLDRLETKVDQILDRLTRMEVRQDSQGARIESHDTSLEEHSQRLREIELRHAVNVATSGQVDNQLNGRWSAIGAAALVILGAIGSAVVSSVAKLFE